MGDGRQGPGAQELPAPASVTTASAMPARSRPSRRRRLSQEGIVLGLAIVLAVGFSLILGERFYRAENVVTLVRSVSTLGMLGLGMAVVIIGRGIDLAMIATMVVAVSWAFVLGQSANDLPTALALGALFTIGVGVFTGILVSYAEIPAIFTTLAMGSVVFGIGRKFFFQLDNQNVPSGHPWFNFLGRGSVLTLPSGAGQLAIPASIAIFGLLALVLFVLLRWTQFGRFVYATGDNPMAARVTGIPTRPLIVAQYTLTSLIAYCSGLVMASAAYGMNTRIYNSTMIYDVLLVVVLGGIGLSGGRGGVRNVLVGTLLVDILLNGMTIMDVNYTLQNLIKSLILLAALVIDAVLNPRDEQTAQQGDI